MTWQTNHLGLSNVKIAADNGTVGGHLLPSDLGGVSSFNTRSGAVSLTLSDVTGVTGTGATARTNLGLALVAFSGAYSDLTGTPTAYSLPTASTATLGGVKVDGTTITISAGVISATSQGGGGSTAFGTPQVLTVSGAIDPTKALIILNSASAIAATLANGTSDGQEIEIVALQGTAQHTVAATINEVSQTFKLDSPNGGVSLNLRWSANRTSWYPRSFDGGYKTSDYVAASAVAGTDTTVITQSGVDRSATVALIAAAVFAAGGAVGKAVSFTPVALTDSASIATNAALGNEFTLVVGATGRTLANPSGLPAGKVQYFSYAISGSGTITAYGTLFDFGAAGTPTDTSNTLRTLHCRWDGTRIEAVYKGGW